jgi:hypothetical protein
VIDNLAPRLVDDAAAATAAAEDGTEPDAEAAAAAAAYDSAPRRSRGPSSSYEGNGGPVRFELETSVAEVPLASPRGSILQLTVR